MLILLACVASCAVFPEGKLHGDRTCVSGPGLGIRGGGVRLLGGAGVASAGNALAWGDANAGIGNSTDRILDSVPSPGNGTPSTTSFSLSSTGYGETCTAWATGGDSPAVYISAAAASGGGSSDRPVGWGNVQNTYYFGVFSSDPNAVGLVPVSFSYDAGVTIAPSGSTLYDFSGSLTIPAQGVGLAFEYNNYAGYFVLPSSDDLSGSQTIPLLVSLNTWTYVTINLAANAGANQWAMGANAYGEESAAGSITASAFIDSTVTVAPTWQAANLDSQLQFDTLETAPEPASLGVLGLGVVGMLMRRRGVRR